MDRILEAVAPALRAEVDRIVQETQQNLESEFQTRLQSAVSDAEASSNRAAEAQIERALAEAKRNAETQLAQTLAEAKALAETQIAQAISETRETVRRQLTEEFHAQLNQKIKETTDQLKSGFNAEMQKASSDWAAQKSRLETEKSRMESERGRLESDKGRLEEELAEARLFADASRQLVEASSQTEMLVRFLKLSERFASSIAIYVSKADGLGFWKSRGGAAFPQIVSKDTIDPEFYFRQIVVREKLIAAVCAAQPHNADALNFLTACLERSIESFGQKLRVPSGKPTNSETAPPADDKVHSEAKRTARLLVSEIKLYHEQEVRDGRVRSDLYQRLRNEIENGREQYRQRVSGAVLGSHDYFHEELVRVLADNDPARLGVTYPGPMSS